MTTDSPLLQLGSLNKEFLQEVLKNDRSKIKNEFAVIATKARSALKIQPGIVEGLKYLIELSAY